MGREDKMNETQPYQSTEYIQQSEFESAFSYDASQELDESKITTVEEDLPREARLLAFDYRLDINSVEEVLALQETDPVAFADRWVNLPDYLRFQIETYLGERNRVGLSEYTLEMKSGQLYGQNMDISMLEMIRNGVDYRIGKGTSEDHERELAELAGFDYINSVMTDPETKTGTMILSVSPPSGSYKKNFYDVYTLKENEYGGKMVNVNRFASGLTSRGYVDRMPELLGLEGTEKIPDNLIPKPDEFLARPLLVDRFDSAQDLHEFLHVDIDTMNSEDFDLVKAYAKPFITHYVDTLMEHPRDQDQVKLALKVAINAADYAARQVKDGMSLDAEIDGLTGGVFMDLVEDFSSQRMETVDSDCGGLGDEDLETSNGSPFGVVEMVAKEQRECSRIACGNCSWVANEREVKEIQAETLKSCPECGWKPGDLVGPSKKTKKEKNSENAPEKWEKKKKIFDAKAHKKTKQESKIRNSTEKTVGAFNRIGIGDSLKSKRKVPKERRQI